jgi:Ca2+-binding RTX toxin-like protein
MTTILLGMSGTAPGNTPGQPWDAHWTSIPTSYGWSDSAAVTDPGGFPQLTDPVFWTYYRAAQGTSINLSLDFDGFEQQNIYTLGFVGGPVAFAPWFGYGQPPLVTVDSSLPLPPSGLPNSASTPLYNEQTIMLDGLWNSIKDIEVSNLNAQVLNVSGFVDTWVNAATDNNDQTISLDYVKRGEVTLGDGNDSLSVNVAANEYTWSSDFEINIGNGNDTVSVAPETYAAMQRLAAPAGWTFNSAPQLTTANITVGNGNDSIALSEVSGTIQVGSGSDTINVTDGNSVIWLGSGNDTVSINAASSPSDPDWALDTQIGTSTVHVGTGHANISIDDSIASRTPQTTLNFIHGETGGSTLATVDVVRLGHIDAVSGSFVGGDLSGLTVNLSDYSPGSTTTLSQVSVGGPMLLQIHEAATGSVDAVTIYGNVLTAPHIAFQC